MVFVLHFFTVIKFIKRTLWLISKGMILYAKNGACATLYITMMCATLYNNDSRVAIGAYKAQNHDC